ncbi:MAG: histidine kinase [Alphaproteobacteria bacterium]|nr:histidine kinase [Alphaproteobacteria bacterium]
MSTIDEPRAEAELRGDARRGRTVPEMDGRGKSGSKDLPLGMPKWLWNFLLIAVLATAFGLFRGASEMIHGISLPVFVSKLIGAWSWGLLMPAVFAADRRMKISEDHLRLRVVALLLLSIPFSIAHVLIDSTLEYPLGDAWNPFRSPEYGYFYWIDAWTTYCAIIGTLYAIRYYQRYASSQLRATQLEKRLLQSHLHNLHMQLEPHFISNALNAISSELEGNPSLARKTIEDLGVLLRFSHEYRDRQLIPLTEEIALLERYLAIQRLRFGDRLKLDIHIDPAVQRAAVPCLLIQPLVENSIRHGLSGARSRGTVEILAKCVEGDLEIRVRDDGVGLPPEWQLDKQQGQGLRLTRERLAALYPAGDSRFSIANRKGQGTEVVIRLPLQPIESVR